VRGRVLVAPGLDATELFDHRQLLLGFEHDTVEEGHLVKRAGDRALHAGAVVTPHVEDQRVLQIAHLLDSVEQAAHIPVRVGREAGKDLHLADIELFLGIRQRVPGREQVRARGQLSILGDDTELLLALKRLLTISVPPLVERALVLVGPLLGHVMRSMRTSGGVVHEPRLGRILCPDRMQPLDRLVRQVVGEVVLLTVLPFRHAERCVVLRDDGIVLACSAAQEAPEVIEAPGLRPVVERPGSTLDVVGREVPLAEATGHVAVLLQDTRQRGATPGSRRAVSRERARIFGDRAETHAVVVATGHQARAGR